MKKFDLIDIDENNLPNVELSNEQMKRIKNIFNTTIKSYLELNHKPVDIDLSPNNLSRVTDNLGTESEDILNYVKGGKILRDLVIEALDKECPIKEEDLIYKALLYISKDYSYKVAGILFSESVFSHRIYVTKNYVFIYNLDNYFRLLNSTKLPISAIKSAYIDNSNRTDYIPFNCDVLTLNLDDSEDANLQLPSIYYLIGENGEKTPDLEGLLNALSSVGVKNKKEKDKPFDKYALWIIGILTILAMGYLFFTHITPILGT